MKGGIQLLDPFLQTQSLLAKLVICGLSPRNKPWKKLLRYKIDTRRPFGDAKWHSSRNWLFFNRALKKENLSPLMESCIRAFILVKGGLSQKNLELKDQVLKQSLFKNPLIVEESNVPLGMGPNLGLHLWVKARITQGEDLWDERTGDWFTMDKIQCKLLRKGAVIEQGRQRCLKIVSHISWEPCAFTNW